MNPQNLQKARKKAKVTQADLAKILGVKQATVSKYESGEIIPSVEILERIADALNLDPRDLIANPEDPDMHAVMVAPFCASSYALTEKLRAVGWNEITTDQIDIYELSNGEHRFLVTAEELKQLDAETNSFMKYKLEELRAKKA